MTTLYSARWLYRFPAPIENGAIAIDGSVIAGVGQRRSVAALSRSRREAIGEAAIIPGLINAHTHLELTAMRGFLDNEEGDFFAWLRKLTIARLERMTPDDLRVSATWGACEALRAGITCVADASDSAAESINALCETGLRGIVYQESFGPDPKLARANFEKLRNKVSQLRSLQTSLVLVGVSPHAPYTVCPPQLEMIAEFAVTEGLPLMMHAAESAAEQMLLREGKGSFAERFVTRNIEWQPPSLSTISYLGRPAFANGALLSHCITSMRPTSTVAKQRAKPIVRIRTPS